MNKKVDAFSRHSNLKMRAEGLRTAKARMAIDPERIHTMESGQGAAKFNRANTVFAAANFHGHRAGTVNINISCLKAVCEDILTAQAFENNPKGRMGSYTNTVQDKKQTLTAVFEGPARHKLEKNE